MENKDYNLSDIISTRVLESIKKLDAKENPRVCIKQFDEIKIQIVGNLHVFSHPIYSKVRDKEILIKFELIFLERPRLFKSRR